MQKREQKATFNIKKQGLAELNRFIMNNELLYESTYYDETEGYSEDLLSYNMGTDLTDEVIDSTGSLGKTSYLMMHPGLASQLSSASPYYS